jgi:hypothetical protein
MRHYITFEESNLNLQIATIGLNLHKVAEQITYFRQCAKIKGVEHDAVSEIAIEHLNEALRILRTEFNLQREVSSCLVNVSLNDQEVIKRANKDHA